MPDEVSPGELARRLERLEYRLDERVVFLNAYRAEREADQHRVNAVRDSVKEIQDSLTWISRAAITGIVLPILLAVALVIVLGGRPT